MWGEDVSLIGYTLQSNVRPDTAGWGGGRVGGKNEMKI